MSEALKDWLPITVRNRVALGFAFAALVMFLVWNCLPDFQSGSPVMAKMWVDIADPDIYLLVIRSPSMDGFLLVSLWVSLFLNGLIVLAIVPFWKIIHSSNYLRMPLALGNFAGGLLVLWLIIARDTDYFEPDQFAMSLLIALTMFALSASLFIFKNELGLRHEREVEELMASSDRAQKLVTKMDKLPELHAADRMSRDETHER